VERRLDSLIYSSRSRKRSALQGISNKLLVKLDPKLYQKYIQMQNQKSVLYLELKQALHGTLKAALLFWKKLSAQLKEWGFKINL
jgi:hypothetical protein